MNKKFTSTIIGLSVIFLASAQNTAAYGGGSTFPTIVQPPQVRVICINTSKIISIPFGKDQKVSIPKCEVETVKSTEAYIKDVDGFQKRLQNFIKRLQTGQD